MADKDETEKTIAEDLVVTKYKMAGDIVNREYIFNAGTNFSHLLRPVVGSPYGLSAGRPALARWCHVD